MYHQRSTIVYSFFLVLGVNSYYLYPHYYYGPYSFKPVPVSESSHFALQRTRSQELSSDNNVTSLDLERQQYWGPIQTFLARVCVNTNSCPVAAPVLCQQCSCPSCLTSSTACTCPAPAVPCTAPVPGTSSLAQVVPPPENDDGILCDGGSASPKGTIQYTKKSKDNPVTETCTFTIVTFTPYNKITVICDSIGFDMKYTGEANLKPFVGVPEINTPFESTTKLMVISVTVSDVKSKASCRWKAEK